jgi:hypothetical protein
MRNLIIPVMLLAAPAVAAAQDTPASPASIGFPGSLNMTIGNVTPTEPGNVVSLTMLEQGVTVWRHKQTFVSAIAQVSIGRDTDHYAWNNRRPITAGFRFSQVMANSVLQLNAGESVVNDATTTSTVVKPVAYASYWAGWRHPLSSSRFSPHALPGTFWVTSGVVSGLEPNNWVTTGSFDQGATVYEHGRTALIPYTRFTASTDTRGFTWNNRTSVDAGLKVRRTVMGGVVDAGVAARRQYERVSGTSRTAGVAFVELWYGWNPRALIR